MPIARIAGDNGEDFAVGADGEGWIPLADLGLRAESTSDVIVRWGAVQDHLDLAAKPAIRHPSFACPVVRPGKIMAIGLNYMDHIRETNANIPERPVVFAKFPSSVIGPFDHIVVDPAVTAQPDQEAELGVIIGQGGRALNEEHALEAVFGYCVANDVSARDLQAVDPQLSRSKSLEAFCPLGPWLTTADAIASPGTLRIRSWVNGEPRQDSTTAEMVFGVAELIAQLSAGMTLHPGDVILTGTPHGVGFAMHPPTFLGRDDSVRIEIDELGTIENRVDYADSSR